MPPGTPTSSRSGAILYQGRDAQKLQEGYVAPGKQVRGWVAFIVPAGAAVDYVQFRPSYLDDRTLNIDLRAELGSPAW